MNKADRVREREFRLIGRTSGLVTQDLFPVTSQSRKSEVWFTYESIPAQVSFNMRLLVYRLVLANGVGWGRESYRKSLPTMYIEKKVLSALVQWR